MKQETEREALVRQIDEYEKSLKDCSVKELRDLRYKLKQVKEKLRSLHQVDKIDATIRVSTDCETAAANDSISHFSCTFAF